MLSREDGLDVPPIDRGQKRGERHGIRAGERFNCRSVPPTVPDFLAHVGFRRDFSIDRLLTHAIEADGERKLLAMGIDIVYCIIATIERDGD